MAVVVGELYTPQQFQVAYDSSDGVTVAGMATLSSLHCTQQALETSEAPCILTIVCKPICQPWVLAHITSRLLCSFYPSVFPVH